MKHRSILVCLAIGLLGFGACTEAATELVEPEAGVDAAPGATADVAYGVQTELSVRYYYPNCLNGGIDHGGGEWSFPAMLGGPGCLVARIVPPGNTPPTGFVLWQMCGVPGDIGPKEDCDAGDRTWNPRTGEIWTAVDALGLYTTSTHTTACNGFSFTRGYRYLYSKQHPDDTTGRRAIVTSEAINVTSDGVNC